LTAEVPKDAAVVIVFGPQQAFLPEETTLELGHIIGRLGVWLRPL
jgi:hypothetical protein